MNFAFSRAGPKGCKASIILNATEHEISVAHIKIKIYFAFKVSDVVFILLINVKAPTTVGILKFMSRINLIGMCSRGSLSTLVRPCCLSWLLQRCGKVSEFGYGRRGIGDKHCFACYIWHPT